MGHLGLIQPSPLLKPSTPRSPSVWVPKISVSNEHLKSPPHLCLCNQAVNPIQWCGVNSQVLGGGVGVGMGVVVVVVLFRNIALPLTTMWFRMAM